MNLDLQDARDTYERGYFAQLVEALRVAFRKVVEQGGIIVIGKSGQALKGHFTATKTWNPANLAPGAQTTTTVTVPGAVLGDNADEATAGFSLDLQGLQLSAYVSATDTVTVVLVNPTAGAINLASGTLRASAWRH